MATNPYERPAHHGVSFAPPLHTHPEGPTDPSKTKLPKPFVVAVIGASRGIGAGIALSFAQAGASGFFLTARSDSSLHDVSKQILGVKPDAKIVCQGADVTEFNETREAAEACQTAFGRLDVCVYNASVAMELHRDEETGKERWPLGVVEGSADDFTAVMRTNLDGAYFAAKCFVPLLARTRVQTPGGGHGSFIALSSAAAHSKVPTGYSLSKMGVTRLVEGIHDWHGKDIQAYAVHPGGVLTDLGKSTPIENIAKFLVDDRQLCGGFLVWLTKENRSWLSGRWLSSKWDVTTLEGMKEEIVEGDKLKFKMVV